jgi:hypothetical protein
MVPAFKKCVLCLIVLVATITSGCCYPSDSFVPFRIDGIVKDGSGNSIQNERIVVTVPFIVHDEKIVSFTDQEGQFSCDAFNSEGAVVCFIPPTFLFGKTAMEKLHFTISIPNRSRYDYEIDFPRKEFRSKKIEGLPSNQNTHIGDKEIEMQGVLRVTKDLPNFYAIIELDMVINNKSSPPK